MPDELTITNNYLAMVSSAVSGSARSFIDDVFKRVSLWEIQNGKRDNQRGPKTAPKFRSALEGLVGDLLRAAKDYGTPWLYRPLHKNDFTGRDISYKNFKSATGALRGLRLIQHKLGYPIYRKDFAQLRGKGKASTFKAITNLWELAGAFGINQKNIDEHFRPGLPKEPLQLRTAGRRFKQKKLNPQPMEAFETSAHTKALKDQVSTLNEFLQRQDIKGQTHFGYVRIFGEGDKHKPYRWNKGGRLYSTPPASNYQQASQKKRALMTINGERVVEIDISASNLTIFLGVLKVPFDRTCDLYEAVNLVCEKKYKRTLVKLWITASFGNNRPIERWPNDMSKDFAKDHHGKRPSNICTAQEVGKRVLEAYPALSRLGEDGVPSGMDLQFLESEIILGTMLHLMPREVPTLSMHDAIIVPVSKAELAACLLLDHFAHHTGVLPRLDIKDGYQPPEAVETLNRAIASIEKGQRYKRAT